MKRWVVCCLMLVALQWTVGAALAAQRGFVPSENGYDNPPLLQVPQVDATEQVPLRDAPTEVWVDDSYYDDDHDGGNDWGTNAFAVIQDGINAVSPGGTVHVAGGTDPLGTYPEAIVITKPLSLLGAGSGTTTIDARAAVSDIAVNIGNTTGSVTFDGFKVLAKGKWWPDDTFGMNIVSTGTTVTVTHNFFQGDGNPDNYDFGVYCHGSTASLNFQYNTVTDTGGNPILVEKNAGATEVSYNTLDAGSWGLGCWYMTYGSLDVTSLQRFSNNTFDLGTGALYDYDHGFGAISIVGAYRRDTAEYGPGGFTNVEIGNNHFFNGHEYCSGIGLYNYRAGDGTGGIVSGAVVENNTVEGLGAAHANSYGVRAMGLVTNSIIRHNAVKYMENGVIGTVGPYGAHYPTDVQVFDCSLASNTRGVLWDASAPTLDASANWWGSASPIWATLISGSVDYTPWMATVGTYPSWGYAGNFSTLWVDDNSPQVLATGRIQEGVDLVSGSTVNVAAGTYREQVKIDGKSLTLAGAGMGASIIEAVDLVSRTTYSITQWTGSVRTIDACVGVVGLATVHISGFTVDGRSLGPDNFYGIHFFDADGSVTGCRIEDILDGPNPSSSRVVSLVAVHGLAGDFDVDFSGNVIPNMQKGGILIMGPQGVCTLEANHITDTLDPVLAANGIQISYGSTGTLIDNDVSGPNYAGGDWAGSGILLFECDDVSVTGGIVEQCDVGIGHSQWDWVYAPTVTPVVDVASAEVRNCDFGVETHLGSPGATLDFGVSDCYIHDCSAVGVELWGSGAGCCYSGWEDGTLNAVVEGCNIAAASAGVEEWVEPSGNTVNVQVRDCSFEDCADYGIYNYDSVPNVPNTINAEMNWWGDVGGPVLVSGAKMGAAGGMDGRMPSPFPAGDEELLSVATWTPRSPDRPQGSRAGVNVSPYVDFDPWRGGNIVCVPDPKVLSGAVPAGDVIVSYLGGGAGGAYGYSIDVQWDNAVVSATTASFTRPAAGPFHGAEFFQVVSLGSNKVRIDAALGGGQPGTPGPADLFKATFTAVGSHDYWTSPVDLTIQHVRDNNNNDLLGFTADDGQIIVDRVGPSVTAVFIDNTTLTHTDAFIKDTDFATVTATVTDADLSFGIGNIKADLSDLGGSATAAPNSYIGTTATWVIDAPPGVDTTPTDGVVTVTVIATDPIGNTASGSDTIIADNTKPTAMLGLAASPGHKKVNLAWTDASSNDLNYAGVLIRYARWNGYPLYSGGGPAYPEVPGDGAGTAFDGTGTSATHSFGAYDRDIYYYGGLVYDEARNYSVGATSGQARATNYWLGDVVPSGAWDGWVTTNDISALSTTYYQDPITNTHCNVGPTHNHSRLGIPQPDAAVDFEDMMIFAMNFGVVAPMTEPPVGLPGTQTWGPIAVSVRLPDTMPLGSEFTVPVILADDRGVAQGVRFSVEYDARVLQYVSAVPGSLVTGCEQHFFMPVIHEGLPLVSAAALGSGATFGRSGELAILRFRCIGQGPVELALRDLCVRNVLNEDLLAQSSDVVVNPDVAVTLPREVSLHGNQPNPFSHGTSIAYGLPSAQPVRLAVYDVSGRLVRVLVDGVTPAGEQTIQWDRRDSGGRVMPGGVYLYRLETRERTLTHKLIVMD